MSTINSAMIDFITLTDYQKILENCRFEILSLNTISL